MKPKSVRPHPRASPLNPATQPAWRKWLEDHFGHSNGVWLVVFKKNAPPGSLRYEPAVEEALCFGWIDGQLQTLDALRFLIWFSPRKPNSVWSESNKRRVRKLIREGRMTPAGLARVQQARRSGQWQAATVREDPGVIPPLVARALARRKGALARFRKLAGSHRKMFLYWIASAKRDETKRRRIQQLTEFLDKGEKRFPWDRGGAASQPAKKRMG